MTARSLEGVCLDWRIWLLALGTFAIGTDAFVISGVLPAIASGLQISPALAGQAVSVYSLTYALGSPLLAAAAARFPRRKVVLGTLVSFGLANVLGALAVNYPLLLLSRVLAGGTAALYTPTAYAMASSAVEPARRGAALAAVALGLTCSTVLGVPLGVVVGTSIGWRATFCFVAALSACAAAMLSFWPLPSPIAAMSAISGGRSTRLAPLTHGRTLLALMPSAFWCAASMMVYTYISVLLRESGYTASNIVMLLFAYGVGGLLGNQFGGRMCDRFGWRLPIALGLALLTLDQLILPYLIRIPIAATILLVFWSFCGWSTWAPQQTRLISYEPKDQSVILALGNSTVYLGSAAGATLGGAILWHRGALALPFYAAALLVVSLITFFFSEIVCPSLE